MWEFAYRTLFGLRIVVCTSLLTIPCSLQAQSLDADELADLSLEELMAIEIVSVADQAKQALSNASAHYVISADDIRRSGRLTVPEILRMAPGVHVGRIDSNKWAVGLRGLNGRFRNNYLVLLDGRSMYSRSLPGINWEQVDAVLPLIDRIEIIRGPGASLWGSNAMHGVINIVTKSAEDTQGTQLNSSLGSHTDGALSIAHSGRIGDDRHYRIYAQAKRYSAFDNAQGQEQGDDWERTLFGARYDWQLGPKNTIHVSGEAGRGSPNEMIRSIDFSTLSQAIRQSDNTTRNHHLMARWSHRINNFNQIDLQLYYDAEDRDTELVNIERDTFDFDFKHRVRIGDGNTLIWGMGYRHSEDLMRDTALTIATPNDLDVEVKQAFIQSEIKLGKRLTALVGAKFEDNSFSDFEIQPSLKLSWDGGATHHSWASIAKAVRTPTRAGTQISINVPSLLFAPNSGINVFPLSLLAQLVGNTQLQSEEMIAYELGHRWREKSHGFSISFYYNDYRKLNGTEFGALQCNPSNTILAGLNCQEGDRFITAPLIFNNTVGGHTHGLEFDAFWSPSDRLKLEFNVSQINYGLEFEATQGGFRNELAEQQNPRKLANLKLNYHITPEVSVSTWGRHVSRIEGVQGIGPGFPAYTTLDLQFSWTPTSKSRISLSGINLIDDDHSEFGSELGEVETLPVPRMIRLFLELRF